MTTPSLLKRLEAVESVQSPRKPIMMFRPYLATETQLAAFEADLAARKAASPASQVYIVTWGDAA
jgi:hypothetical protein